MTTKGSNPASFPNRPTGRVGDAWARTSTLPGGARLFSFLFARKTPYAASVTPRFVEVEPHRVVLRINDKKRVRNHLGTVHAIAVCTGLETAAGTLAEVTVGPDQRWIPSGMNVSYKAKASGDVTCIAETEHHQWPSGSAEVGVRVRGELSDGTVVIQGVINLWVTPRR